MNGMARLYLVVIGLVVMPAFGQTMYKCPDESGTVKFQQMPCSPTGGGEAMQVKKLPGSGEGLRPEEAQTLKDFSEHNAAADKARAEQRARIVAEEKRQEALNVEREKAEAQRATAAAIWATGWRRRW